MVLEILFLLDRNHLDNDGKFYINGVKLELQNEKLFKLSKVKNVLQLLNKNKEEKMSFIAFYIQYFDP